MDRKIVQALQPFSISVAGVPHMIGTGDMYYEDDPVVKAARTCFGDVSVRSSIGSRHRVPMSSGSVETASAEPGGRRRMSRPHKVEPSSTDVTVTETLTTDPSEV